MGREQALPVQAPSSCWVAGHHVSGSRLSARVGRSSGLWLSRYSQDDLWGVGNVNSPNFVYFVVNVLYGCSLACSYVQMNRYKFMGASAQTYWWTGERGQESLGTLGLVGGGRP